MDECAHLEMLRMLARRHVDDVRAELARAQRLQVDRLADLHRKLAIAERAVIVLEHEPPSDRREQAAA